MAETSIEWTDFTVNFWWGCTKVGPGCDHCYAETWDKRTGGAHWGPHAERRRIKGAAAALRKINDKAGGFRTKHGRWPRVFMHSMSDLFDNAVPYVWREHALAEAQAAFLCNIQMVTKRIGNVEEMVFPVWGCNWPQHIGLMITVCTQAEADRDIPKLLDLKARLGIPWIGLSVEPMLGPISLRWLEAWPGSALNPSGVTNHLDGLRKLDWVICGGESGPHARPMHPDWPRSLRDQCVAAGVPFLFKQWGEWAPGEVAGPNLRTIETATWFDDAWDFVRVGKATPEDHREDDPDLFRVGKKAAGRHLDDRTWDEVPA